MSNKSGELIQLRDENARLRRRIEELQSQLDFLGRHKDLAAGMRGEQLISKVVDGQLTLHTAPVDVLTASGMRIEVKFGKTTVPVPTHPSHTRWQWNKIFGETGRKDFDFLILVGEASERHRHLYKDQASPYVFFCLDREQALLVASADAKGQHSILLSSNPLNTRSRASKLFGEFQVTAAELAQRFGTTVAAAAINVPA